MEGTAGRSAEGRGVAALLGPLKMPARAGIWTICGKQTGVAAREATDVTVGVAVRGAGGTTGVGGTTTTVVKRQKLFAVFVSGNTALFEVTIQLLPAPLMINEPLGSSLAAVTWNVKTADS